MFSSSHSSCWNSLSITSPPCKFFLSSQLKLLAAGSSCVVTDDVPENSRQMARAGQKETYRLSALNSGRWSSEATRRLELPNLLKNQPSSLCHGPLCSVAKKQVFAGNLHGLCLPSLIYLLACTESQHQFLRAELTLVGRIPREQSLVWSRNRITVPTFPSDECVLMKEKKLLGEGGWLHG